MSRKPKRQIVGLRWAKLLQERPKCIPVGRPKGIKAQGMRYERLVGEAISAGLGRLVRLSPWFEFEDANGYGYCSPDLIFLHPRKPTIYVGECKLSSLEEGERDLENLYLPVARMALEMPACGFIILKNVNSRVQTFRLCENLDEVLAAEGMMPILHYLGRGLLGPRLKVPLSAAG